MLLFLYAVSLLFFASIGAGVIIMRPIRHLLPPLSIWLYTSVAYFLGQGVLGSSLLILGLAGWFTPVVVKSILLAFTVTALIFFFIRRLQWRDCIMSASRAWISAPLEWKGLALLLLMLLGYGSSTFYGGVAGDAYAFYLALPKVISASHTVAPLPGYEGFSTVGYLAEILLAALYSLGLPDAAPRCYSLINFIPALILFYGLARECRLSRRGALLVVIMVTTSSAGAVLWGSGKTDLFAVGPAIAAYLFSIIKWEKGSRTCSLLAVGIFAGFACVFKLSYMVMFIPSILVLSNWRFIIEGCQSLYQKKWAILSHDFFSSLKNAVLIFIAFFCAFAPHMVKNVVINGAVIGMSDYGSFYSTATIVRIILSYPFALTFGDYWAQLGALSPLFLAFAPLIIILPKPYLLRENKVAAVGFATFIGLLFWIVLFPSYFLPRYFLATLFMFSIPVAAGADIISRQRTILAKIIIIAVYVTLVTTPSYTNFHFMKDSFPTFSANRFHRFFSSGEHSFLYADDFPYSLSHKAINEKANQHDRILLLTYYRLWLRPDLLQAVSTSHELALAKDPNKDFWTLIREKQFRFILWDKNIVKLDPKLFNSPPKDIQLIEIYNNGPLIAYEINMPDVMSGLL